MITHAIWPARGTVADFRRPNSGVIAGSLLTGVASIGLSTCAGALTLTSGSLIFREPACEGKLRWSTAALAFCTTPAQGRPQFAPCLGRRCLRISRNMRCYDN
jgi:hypothetical protein